jgi:hypothetical protein
MVTLTKFQYICSIVTRAYWEELCSVFYISPFTPGPLLQEVKINYVDNVTLLKFVFWVVTKYGLGITT